MVLRITILVSVLPCVVHVVLTWLYFKVQGEA